MALNVCSWWSYQISEANSVDEKAALRARLQELQVEHCCLCNLMITSNARLFGPWKHGWMPLKQLQADLAEIMVCPPKLSSLSHLMRFWLALS